MAAKKTATKKAGKRAGAKVKGGKAVAKRPAPYKTTVKGGRTKAFAPMFSPTGKMSRKGSQD